MGKGSVDGPREYRLVGGEIEQEYSEYSASFQIQRKGADRCSSSRETEMLVHTTSQ